MNLLDVLPIGAIIVSGLAIVLNRSGRLRLWLSEHRSIRNRGLINLVLDGIFIAWAFYFISTGTLIPSSLARGASPHARPVISTEQHDPAIAPVVPAHSPDEPPADETA